MPIKAIPFSRRAPGFKASWDPFSQRMMELIREGAIKETSFRFVPLRLMAWVEPRVTAGTFNSVAALHLDIAYKHKDFRLGRARAFEAEPSLPSEEQVRSRDVLGEAVPVLREIRAYRKKYGDPRSEARIYWDAKNAFEEFRNAVYDAHLKWHISDFEFDSASNNFLFRGFDRKGRLLVSVIDQPRKLVREKG